MSQLIEKKSNKAFVLKITKGLYKGKQLKLLGSDLTIGRANECDVIFKDDTSCSRRHAQIQREKDSFLIRSLNDKNPVLVNDQPVKSQILKQKDQIQIGQTEMIFLEREVTESPSSGLNQLKKKAVYITPPRLILILFLLAGAYLFLSEDKTKIQADKELKLKTEADILKQVEELNKQTEEEKQNLEMNFKEEASRAAFLAGFRDYRKGYFDRALKQFKHCSMLDKKNELCLRYELKSNAQIEKLIQKKMRLGNAYKANKQYKACEAVFKSVETMVLDVKSPIYKEAQAKKLACSIHLRNKI